MDIDRTITPLPPAVVTTAPFDSTPPLVATTRPSPALDALVSPALQPADGFELPTATASPAVIPSAWRMPECWGHRGASASFPENTRMSFIEACKAGADGIETDIHITADNILVMFHDPELSRTTDGTGRIHSQPWAGVLEHVRTLKSPHQPIPRFTELLEILMEPENAHIKVNIDCKVENEPTKLFPLVRAALEAYPDWQTSLAPRIVLGLWHPRFLAPAATHLPGVQRFCISMSVPQVREYFWSGCHGFSVWYRALLGDEGAAFRAECAAAGKALATWTVNERDDMLQCARWGLDAVISDKPELWREVKREVEEHSAEAFDKALLVARAGGVLESAFMSKFPPAEQARKAQEEFDYLEREGGKWEVSAVLAA